MTLTKDSITQTTLLHDRYGTAFDVVFNHAWNTSLTTLLSHRSIRAYLSKPLPSGTLELLVAAAQSASTSSNLQTWSVVAVEDPARKERLSQLANGQAHIRQAPLFLVWLADLARLKQVTEQRELPHAGLEYLETFLTAAIDASLAAQNAAIAAESLGLGTVYIGAMRNRPDAVAAELGLPPHVFAVFGLCVGYADPAKPAAIKPRLSQTAVLHQEQYSLDAQLPAIAEYNDIMKAFYTKQKMTVEGDWSQHSSDRIATAEALRNRANLREILNKLGFALR
ncbi:MAG: NADPH-dependent oxidoreductase [Tildeniella nuda ZEHNDER 1965/U140]|jgi:nitroreductase|nr:NADPH-dependent oxidoreductase [Tildeniella nuda ZEHNDER 1965/U140]